MNFAEALEYIHGTQRFGSKPGLDRITALCAALGNPERKLKFVHVAGTNGKGSTTAMTASITRAAGLKTGFFISPFITEFRERIQIDGEMIPKDELANRIGRMRGVIDRMIADGGEHPTEFELVTALALEYFADMRCDIVALEVGMGGRFDATNIIPAPEVAVVTTISFDHVEYLGDTLRAIAGEKCGIIKRGCEAVTCCGQLDEPLAVIGDTCRAMEVPLTSPDESQLQYFESGLGGSRIIYKGLTLDIPLIGAHQIVNALTAVEAVLALRRRGFNITDSNIVDGINATRWHGRLEVLRQQPVIVIDAAHNADGFICLSAAIDSLFSGKRLITVMGMLKDKDFERCVPLIARRSSAFFATPTRGERGLSSARIARVASIYCAKTTPCEDVAQGVKMAIAAAGKDDVIIGCGSFTLIGEVRKLIIGKNN